MPEEKLLDQISGLRNKIDQHKSDKQRLEGKLEIQKKAVKDMEQECRDKYEVEITDLEKTAKQLREEARRLKDEAERILRGDTSV